MASRQLRKLRQQQDALISKKEAEGEREESEDEPAPVATQRKNVFSAFAALGDDGDDNDEDDEDNKSDQDGGKNGDMDGQVDEAAPPKKSKKSKKKKKKGKQPLEAKQPPEKKESLDDIDRALQELKLQASKQPTSKGTHTSAGSGDAEDRYLLRINFHHLKALNEMRKLFGKTIEVAEAESSGQTNRTRIGNQEVSLETYLSGAMVAGPLGPGRAAPPKQGMFDTILRSNPFIEGKKTWPKGSALGLKMIHVPHQHGHPEEYTFSHDSQYDKLESTFFYLVQMGDPMQLVHFLQRNPYHVSSLIQVSKYAKQQDQNQPLAADLIERALFSFGRVCLKSFRTKLEQGQAFLEFRRPENRQFFLAGWHLIQYLISKGTVRTALEWSKLFLSLNPEDPYGMINWIHVLAIRAHEAQWFVNLCKSNLISDGDYFRTRPYFEQTLVLAHLQLGDIESAKKALIRGIEQVPWLYCALFSALNLDTPKSIWGVQPRHDDETLHTKLYVHMTKDLWSAPQTTSLLIEAAKDAQKANLKTLPPGPVVSLSTARFIYLDNNPELMAAVPRQMLHQSPNFEFDPLPPPKSENIFSSRTQEMQWNPPETEGTTLPGFLNDPRIRAALRARVREEAQARDLDRALADALGDDDDDDLDEGWDEQQRRHLEDMFAREEAAARDGAPPPASRGFLAQVLDLMMGGGWGGGGDLGSDEDWDDVDEFEGEDDFEDEDDDDELPDLEPVPSANPRHARVEDAEDSDEEAQGTRR